jgi:hypothetical protein
MINRKRRKWGVESEKEKENFNRRIIRRREVGGRGADERPHSINVQNFLNS